MIYPTINDLTKGRYNRYELVIATAKCARLITDEYVAQRNHAESVLAGNKEGGLTILQQISPDLANKKAVKNAIDHIYAGDYEIVDRPVESDADAAGEED